MYNGANHGFVKRVDYWLNDFMRLIERMNNLGVGKKHFERKRYEHKSGEMSL